MKFRQFWNTVPKPVRLIAIAIMGIGVLIGFAVGFREGLDSGQFPILIPSFGAGILGLFMGTMFALFILCLGYVYADARRRAMPPVLWTLIAALVPNLLGFLFYFALRKPIAAPCAHCRQPLETGQRFCSHCGFDTSSAGNAGSQPVYTGLGSNPT